MPRAVVLHPTENGPQSPPWPCCQGRSHPKDKTRVPEEWLSPSKRFGGAVMCAGLTLTQQRRPLARTIAVPVDHSPLAAFSLLGAEMRDVQRQQLRLTKDGHQQRGGRGRKGQRN